MQADFEDDERLMEAFDAAMQLPLPDREDYLRRVFADSPELFCQAFRLVQYAEKMGSFMLHPMIVPNEAPHPFQPGEVILDRFEILREIGEGSMGVVYEASDRIRNLHIAIKAAKPGFQRMLSPELEGALTVRHPNVCLVNEIHTVRNKFGEIRFLTMELLQGETLLAHLERRGKIPESEALPIARQLCAGLSAAHRGGVLHRDFKSANIILCPTADAEPRVVITDFGLSGSPNDDADLGGTFPYMAPELWHAAKTSKASDLYALGVVLYETVADPELKAIEDADVWTPNTTGLSKPWAEALRRCAAASPEMRPSDAADVLAILEKRPSPWRFLLAIPLLALIALCFPQVRTWVHDRIWPPPNVRLAILPPQTSGSTNDLAGGVLQDVSNRISHLTSGARLVEVISPVEARKIRAQTVEQAAELHATHAFQTSIKQDRNDVVVSGDLIDLKTGVDIRKISARYAPPSVGAIPTAIAGTISAGLGLEGKGNSERLSSAATVPYDRGLQLLAQDGDAAEASNLFREASILDPRSPLPLAGLVQAEARIFDATKDRVLFAQAQDDLRQAEKLNPDSVSVHFAAGLLYEENGEFEKARQEYTRANQLEPHNTEALLGVANTYAELDMPEQAIATYRVAINLDPAFYRPYEYLGEFYYNRGDYSKAVEQYSRVTQLAPKQNLAYAYLSAALRRIGKYPEAEKALVTSLSIQETPAALNNMGNLLASQKRDAEAVRYYDRAVASNPNEYRFLLNSGDSHLRLGEMSEAKVLYRKGMGLALAEFTETPGAAYARACYAYFAARLADKKRAEDEILQALNSSHNDTRVIGLAVITYVVLNLTDRALDVLQTATPQLLQELAREPNLANFSQNPRFKQLVVLSNKGEK